MFNMIMLLNRLVNQFYLVLLCGCRHATLRQKAEQSERHWPDMSRQVASSLRQQCCAS